MAAASEKGVVGFWGYVLSASLRGLNDTIVSGTPKNGVFIRHIRHIVGIAQSLTAFIRHIGMPCGG
jgi:hypothetical protein